MGQRRRIVGEAPRCRGGLRPVPDGCDDDDPVCVGVLDGGLLERRVRVELRAERVTDAAEAEVDDARSVVHGPVNRRYLRRERDGSVRADDLRDHQTRVERKPRHPDPVERIGGDLARHEGAVPLVVAEGRAADERLGRDDPTPEIGMRAVDPGVDHGDPDRRELGDARPERPRLVLLEVPLIRRERLGVVEAERHRGHGERHRGEHGGDNPSHGTWIVADKPAASPAGAQRTR